MTPYDLDGGPLEVGAPDLAAFILARLADREWVAQRTIQEYRTRMSQHGGYATGGGVDPYREALTLLAEVKAKRRIVELHGSEQGGDVCDEWETYPCKTIRHLAAVYADHPDYREEWRP